MPLILISVEGILEGILESILEGILEGILEYVVGGGCLIVNWRFILLYFGVVVGREAVVGRVVGRGAPRCGAAASTC